MTEAHPDAETSGWPEPAVLVDELAGLDSDSLLDRLDSLARWLLCCDEVTRQKYEQALVKSKLTTRRDWNRLTRAAKQQVHDEPIKPAGIPDDADTFDPDRLLAERRLGSWSRECPSIPEGFLVPQGWKIDRQGIRKVVQRRDGDTSDVRVSYGPVLPVATHVDPDGDQLIELVWHDGIRWVTRPVLRAVARAGKKLVATLGNAGFPVTDSAGKDIEAWLAAAEQLNRRIIPELSIARWLGWQADGSFLATYDGNPRVEPRFPEYQTKALQAHRSHGTLLGWQEVVRRIEHLQTAKMVLYASLAAVLLEPLHLNSYTVDMAGLSTRGKTTAARIAVSCWADPRKDGGGFSTWQAAGMYTVEGRLNLVRGLSVVFDETQLIDTRKIDLGAVLYAIGTNQGATRGGGYFNNLPWSCVVIMTGERPATSYTTQQGASARVLTLSEPPFGDATPENKAVADYIDANIDRNFGFVGPLFADRVRQMLASDEGRAAMRERHRKLADGLRGSTDMSGRRAPLVAAIALAALLCEEWGLLPGLSVPKPLVWQQLFVTVEDPADNRPKAALDAALEWVAANDAAIWEPGQLRESPPGGWIGRTMVWDGKPTIAVLPSALKNALERRDGITLATVLPAWKNRGWIVQRRKGDIGYEPDRPFDPKHRLGGKKSSPRMFTFSPDVAGWGGDEPRTDTP